MEPSDSATQSLSKTQPRLRLTDLGAEEARQELPDLVGQLGAVGVDQHLDALQRLVDAGLLAGGLARRRQRVARVEEDLLHTPRVAPARTIRSLEPFPARKSDRGIAAGGIVATIRQTIRQCCSDLAQESWGLLTC